MKNVLKSFGLGLIFFLMSGIAILYGIITWGGFAAVQTVEGWEAVWLVAASFVTGFLSLFTVWCMGVIPLSIINDLKFKLKEQKEDSKRDCEALYKAATYDYKNKR